MPVGPAGLHSTLLLGLSAADLFGIVGLVTLLAGFTLNALGRLAATTRLYQALNLVGSGILAVYALLTEAWVFLPLEVVWAAVAGYTMLRPKPASAGA